jgi:hypothetical protein
MPTSVWYNIEKDNGGITVEERENTTELNRKTTGRTPSPSLILAVQRYLERHCDAPEYREKRSCKYYSEEPVMSYEPPACSAELDISCYKEPKTDIYELSAAKQDLDGHLDDDFVFIKKAKADTHKTPAVTDGEEPSSFRKAGRIPPMASCSAAPSRMPRGRMERRDGLLRSDTLDDMLANMDKSFADTLFHYIDRVGITDVEAYKRANVDKKTFSKIKCNPDYRPSKITAVSFAIGLRLNLDETKHLLSTAGMCLSRSSKFDVIIKYFITSGNYKTIFDVNDVLYEYDQSTLGTLE